MERDIISDLDNAYSSTTEKADKTLISCIKKTQWQLGKYISRPPLLTKYLARPPFLFFHDIITTIINTTGFLRGLYSATELDRMITRSCKANRINFLNKLIMTLQATTGEHFPRFNLAKMSVGSHPLSVNRVLHSVVLALDMNMVSDLAVRKVLGDISPRNIEQGAKRKIDDVDMDDDKEYFGDDEGENCNNTVHKRQTRTFSPERENDDEISMIYENDMALNNQQVDIHPDATVEQSLSKLAIHDSMEC